MGNYKSTALKSRYLVYIFWDYENLSLNDKISPVNLLHHIKKTLQSNIHIPIHHLNTIAYINRRKYSKEQLYFANVEMIDME